MSISVTFNNAHKISLTSEFFMARRPVLNSQHKLVAHELLFCHTLASEAAAQRADFPVATASVVADVCQHGLGRVLGELRGFMQVDAQALQSDIVQFLPPQTIVLAVDERVAATPGGVARMAELAHAGFSFALDVTAASDEAHRLLPMVEVVRIDITDRTREDLEALCGLFRGHQKKLLVEKVENVEQFKACLDLGFDYFQGYHFTKPHILSGKALSPSQLAIAELMALIASDADSAAIENSIKSDVPLALNLLRLVNTPAISAHRIESLRQALMVMGRNQLQRWLQIMFYTDSGRNHEAMLPLMSLATTRGRLLELVAQKCRPGNRGIADTAFTVGIMSLMDALFGMPMQEILTQIPVVEEVSDALLYRDGYFGELLKLVEYTEWVEKTETLLLKALASHRLSCSDLYMLQLAAFEWSDSIARGMR